MISHVSTKPLLTTTPLYPQLKNKNLVKIFILDTTFSFLFKAYIKRCHGMGFRHSYYGLLRIPKKVVKQLVDYVN